MYSIVSSTLAVYYPFTSVLFLYFPGGKNNFCACVAASLGSSCSDLLLLGSSGSVLLPVVLLWFSCLVLLLSFRPTGSGGFTQLYSAYRGMSKSTPTLASDHRQTKGPGEQKKGKVATASKEEQNRQQILEEMKKRTQLLTDNSWIRQHRASSLKEPLYTGGTLRRYESLDSLHTGPPSEPPCELSGPRSLSGSSGRSVYPRYTTCPTPPDQLPSCPVALSQHSFPDASCIPGKAAGDCAVPSISEERDQKFRAETTSLSASVATSSSISSN
ncbi:unnamed protein product [Arctogadus glacialis]